MKNLFSHLNAVFLTLFKIIGAIALCFLMFILFIKFREPKYSGPKYESALYQRLDDIATEYGKKNNCELIHIGDFTEPSKHLRYGIWLRCYSSEGLQQGRTRAVALVEKFLATIQQDPLSQTYFEETKRKFPRQKLDSPNLKQLGIKIVYWDKNVNRPQPPYLSEIAFYDEKFHYYQVDPKTQALRLILEESYAEAIEKQVADLTIGYVEGSNVSF